MDVSYFSLAFFLCTPITATVIQDREYAVLIGGGISSSGGRSSSVEAWFPGETSPCTAPPTVPALPQDVVVLSAAVLGNMIIYCGGLNNPYNDGFNQCYTYTVGSSMESWDPAPSMIHGRSRFTLTNINNVIIATGGIGRARRPVTSVEVYQDGKWTEKVDWELTTPRGGHCAVKYGDSKLVLTGGAPTTSTLVEQLDTNTGEWYQMPSMNQGRYGHSCVSFKDDIIVAGGSDDSDELDSAERFSSATGNWEVLPRLNTARLFHSMAVLKGYPTIMGGIVEYDSGYPSASTEYFNGTQWVFGKLLRENWSAYTTGSHGRSGHGAVVLTCD